MRALGRMEDFVLHFVYWKMMKGESFCAKHRTSKKGLTSGRKSGKINKSPDGDGERVKKEIEKISKNLLTNRKKCDIIDEHFKKGATVS